MFAVTQLVFLRIMWVFGVEHKVPPLVINFWISLRLFCHCMYCGGCHFSTLRHVCGDSFHVLPGSRGFQGGNENLWEIVASPPFSPPPPAVTSSLTWHLCVYFLRYPPNGELACRLAQFRQTPMDGIANIVAYKRWLPMEVQLYFILSLTGHHKMNIAQRIRGRRQRFMKLPKVVQG